MWIQISESATSEMCGILQDTEPTFLDVENERLRYNYEDSDVAYGRQTAAYITGEYESFTTEGAKFRHSTGKPYSTPIGSRNWLTGLWRQFYLEKISIEELLTHLAGSRLTHADLATVEREGRVLALCGFFDDASHHLDGPALEAQFSKPHGLVAAADGNVYIADQMNHAVRRYRPDGVVETLAGGNKGHLDGQGSAARFAYPMAIALGPDGHLYVADTFNHCIRRIDPATGVVTTLDAREAGRVGPPFLFPQGVLVEPDGNLIVSDSWHHRICRLDSKGVVTVVAGGEWGRKDGQGDAARFRRPRGVARDERGNLYVADGWGNRICKIGPGGQVKTLAGWESGYLDAKGRKATFDRPHAVAVDAEGNVLVADTFNHRIRRIAPDGNVTTFAGGANAPFMHEATSMPGCLYYPRGLAIDKDGRLWVANTDDHQLVRIEADGTVTHLAGGKQTSETSRSDGEGCYEGPELANVNEA